MNDFRLSTDVRPTRYALRFDLDLEAWTVRGEATIAIQLARPARAVTLHAVGLELATGDAVRAISYDAEAQTATLELERELPAGAAQLHVRWTGAIVEKLRGLYRSTRPGERYAATQFEAADARWAFPCFDEPAFKARYAIELVHDRSLVALSNMPVLRTEDRPSDRRLTAFAETPPISSYLVAFTVGPYEATPVRRTASGVACRVWLPKGTAALGLYARDAHVRAIEYLEEYTAIGYPFAKVDAIGLADFDHGAMENPGAITYRMTLLAADERTASTATFKAVFSVAAHELTHMWWGDLVTMAWWNDLWLNESFASFVGEKCTATLNPEWGFWRDVVAQNTPAFNLDSLVSTHPISMAAKNVEEAEERFDAVTYLKGQGVLRMIESYLGADTFRRGVRIYLERHRWANATAADFWRALDEASGRDVTALATAWITESGHPLVTCAVRERPDGLTIALDQERFFADPGVAATAQRWPVPMVFRYGTPDGRIAELRYLLADATGSVDLPGASWYYPNGAGAGFYRTAFDDRSIALLARGIAKLTAEERLALLDNHWALARAKKTTLGQVLELVNDLRGEDDRAVITQLAEILGWIADHALRPSTEAPFRALVDALVRPQLDKLGWDVRADDTADEREKRQVVIRTLGATAAASDVRLEARRRVGAHLAGTAPLAPDVAGPIASVGAIDGDRALYDRYVARMREAQATDPQEEARFRGALTQFHEPALVRTFAEAVFTDLIRDQDRTLLYGRLLGQAHSRALAWEALKAEWDRYIVPMDPGGKQRAVTAIGQLTPRALADDAIAFLQHRQSPDIKATAAQAIERIRLGAANAERMAQELDDALGRIAQPAG